MSGFMASAVLNLHDQLRPSGIALELDAHRRGGCDGGSISTQANGTQHPVAVSVIRNATLQSLCQSVAVGPFTLVLRAGAGSTPVSAENLVVDADQLSGNATFTNIAIGQDAGTLNQLAISTG
jgi:hypothetical protein